MANTYLPSTLKPKEQLQAVQLSPMLPVSAFFYSLHPCELNYSLSHSGYSFTSSRINCLTYLFGIFI